MDGAITVFIFNYIRQMVLVIMMNNILLNRILVVGAQIMVTGYGDHLMPQNTETKNGRLGLLECKGSLLILTLGQMWDLIINHLLILTRKQLIALNLPN